MIVLGVDPGTQRLGWGVLDADGVRLRAVDAGVVALPAGMPLPARLAAVYATLTELGRRHHVAAFAVEDVFYAKFPRAAIALGHVRGVVLLAAEHVGASLAEYPPATVKRAVAGRGDADKAQIARMVGALLRATLPDAVDATDALAVAITHAHAAPRLLAADAAATRARRPPARGRRAR